VTNNWKLTLKHIALAIGRSLRFFFLRVIPATWRWLRGTAFPVLRQLYLRLPHRRVVVATGALVAISAVAVTTLLRPSSSGPAPLGTSEPGASIQVAQREARLVDQLLSDDWQAQKSATRSVLESVGATILDDAAPLPDSNGLFVASPELVMLAMDGARKATTSRLTLAELAHMLDDFGFPFPEDQLPSKVLEEAVRAWTKDALENPKLHGAASARFLHAMAARQMRPIDLASPNWTAEQHTLTHLELFAFFAAFADGSPGVAQQVASASRFAAPVGRLLNVAIPGAYAADSRSTVCTPLTDYNKRIEFEQNNKTMEGILGAVGNRAEAAGGAWKGAAKALSWVSNAFKVQKLVLLYSSVDMRLTADQDFVHKAHPGEADKQVIFNVTVGLDGEKYREFVEKMNASTYGKALKECLASLGLPTPSDMNDIVGEMKNWDVSWKLHGGNSLLTMFDTGHASWDPQKNGFKGPNLSRERLTPVDDTHVGADFIVDVTRDEHKEGAILSAVITGEATLLTDGTIPGSEVAAALQASWKTMLEGQFGGGVLGLLGTALGATGTTAVEAASGWARRIWDPEVLYHVTVAYHQERLPAYSYEGTVTTEFSYSLRREHRGRRNEDGEYQDYSESRRSQGKMVATSLRTVRMTPYQMNEGTDIWEISGQGTASGSFALNESTDALVGCAGQLLQRRKEERRRRGGGSNSESGTYSMRIEQRGDRVRDQNYVLHLYFSGAGLSVPYTETFTDVGQAGCEFSSRDGWSRSKTEQKMASAGTNGRFTHTVELSEPYPETIVGQQTVRDEGYDGDEVRTTTWRWSFRRVDP